MPMWRVACRLPRVPSARLGDLYDLIRPDARRRQSADEITVYKNGGGAHLDLMTADYIAGL